jgi:DNA-binding CsgD family transcriptional regulator
MISNQKRLASRLKKINSNGLDLNSLFNEIFSEVKKEIPFRAGWFFQISPKTLQLIQSARQIWNGVAPPEMNGANHGGSLFPTVRQLLQRGALCMRGKEWWSPSHLSGHPFYQAVLKPNHLHFALILILLDGEKKCRGYITLWREKNNGDFTDVDVEALTLASPVIGAHLERMSTPEKNAMISEISEEELHQLVRRRAQPGILILNQEGHILYVNHDAKSLLEALTAKSPSPSPNHSPLPQIVYQLYTQFKEAVNSAGPEQVGPSMPTVNRVCIHEGIVFLFRALLLQKQGTSRDSIHIMVLIEKVSQGVRIDQFVQSTNLTEREQAVVRLLLEGKTNKEVASCMNIGEYTVKDHVKRIMKKLNVTTRAGIVAKILHQHFPPQS